MQTVAVTSGDAVSRPRAVDGTYLCRHGLQPERAGVAPARARAVVTAIRLLAHEPPAHGRLYRAWSADARFPFVEIADGGPYEIVHEDGTADGAEGVTLVEPFDVPAGEDERFVSAWRADHDRLTAER